MGFYPPGIYNQWRDQGHHETVRAFIDENPGASLDVIAQQTGLSKDIILWAVEEIGYHYAPETWADKIRERVCRGGGIVL